jgi:Zn-dependent peptidase ImmA (M78 family)
MNSKRQKQIEDVARNILIDTGYYYAPVRVERIVREMGIYIEEYDFGEKDSDTSGVYVKNGSQIVIGVNSNNGKLRQRFTIAHELGHHILEHQRDGAFIDSPSKYFTILFRDNDSSTGEYMQEREANAFAAALLMPKELVEKVISEYYSPYSFPPENFNLVDVLSKRFEVNTQAMSFRLTNLDLRW